jgi:hypothetical protein
MPAIPEWFKIAYTLAVVGVIIIYWPRHGPRNFLWFSDVALIGAVPAMWLESALISGVIACMVLVPEILWNVDYLLRLALRRRITGLTDYMFDSSIPLWLRTVSLFHVPLPLVLIWLVAAYGYPEVSLAVSAGVGAIVLVLSWWFSSPEKNINWVYGPARVQRRLPQPVYLGALYLGYVLLVFLPTHWLLLRLF